MSALLGSFLDVRWVTLLQFLWSLANQSYADYESVKATTETLLRLESTGRVMKHILISAITAYANLKLELRAPMLGLAELDGDLWQETYCLPFSPRV